MRLPLGRAVRQVWTALGSPRWRKRLRAVAANSANSLLVPLFSPVVSVLVVRLAGVDLWGDYVRVLVVAQLVSHLAGWGNKDFVLRAFARSPAGLTAAWQTSFFTRLALLAVGGAALLLFGFTPARWLLVTLLTVALTLAQSFEVFIVYRRDFVFGLGVEVLTVTLLALPIVVLRGALSLDALLLIFITANLVEAGVYAWRYRAEVGAHLAGRFDLGWLRQAWPFFLLGFTGLLQSRVGLYAVSAWLPPAAVGYYQIYTNLLIYLQSAAAFVLVPFVKALYRLSYRTLLGLSLKLGLVGLAAVLVGVPAAALVWRYAYGLTFAPAYLAAGALFVLPLYAYVPIIYALYKADQPLWVVAANGLGIGVNLALNAWWMPALGALGAAWAAAATQWLLLGVYLLWGGRLARGVTVAPLSELAAQPESGG